MADERMNLNAVPVPEVEDDNHPENAGNETRIHHMRSTLATTVKCLGAVREKLTNEHLETMKKTPFYLLLIAIYKDQLTTSQCRKMDNNIVSVVQLFNARTRSVKLGMEEKEIVVSKGGKKKTAFVERLFPKGEKLEQKLLKERLDELVQKREQVDIEDTVRIICLILISSLFFCSTGLRIPWGWVDFVENLDEIKCYDWCGKILSTLLDSMTAKKEKPSKINGCTLFLFIGFVNCEHATVVTPKPRNPKMTVPRVLKWNLPDLWTKVTKDRLMNLTREQVEIGGPYATLREMLLFRKLESSDWQLGELNLQTTNDNVSASMIEQQKPRHNDKENDKKVENEIKNLREENLRLTDAKDSALVELHNAKLQNETLKKELSTLEKEKSSAKQKMQQQTDSLQTEITRLRTEKASFENTKANRDYQRLGVANCKSASNSIENGTEDK
ncbi:hypothetical protein OROMI_006588 [Orobanche minor]